MPMELLNTALIVATFIITFWFGIAQLKNAIRPAIKIAIVQSDEFSETVQIELCRMPQRYLFRKIITIHPTHCGILEYGVGQFNQRTQSYIRPPKSITLNCWINASFSTNESSLFWFTINKSSRKHGIELKFKHVEFPYYVSIQIPMPQNNESTA